METYHLFPGAPDRDDPNLFAALRPDGDPLFAGNRADFEHSRLAVQPCRDIQQPLVLPQPVRLDKVQAELGFVGNALGRVEVKLLKAIE